MPALVFQDWLPKHYSGVISEALAETDRPNVTIRYVSDMAAENQRRLRAALHRFGFGGGENAGCGRRNSGFQRRPARGVRFDQANQLSD